ncbi:MAG: hypothetical protein ABR497_06215 [Kiritimatiellia bacterium]
MRNYETYKQLIVSILDGRPLLNATGHCGMIIVAISFATLIYYLYYIKKPNACGAMFFVYSLLPFVVGTAKALFVLTMEARFFVDASTHGILETYGFVISLSEQLLVRILGSSMTLFLITIGIAKIIYFNVVFKIKAVAHNGLV